MKSAHLSLTFYFHIYYIRTLLTWYHPEKKQVYTRVYISKEIRSSDKNKLQKVYHQHNSESYKRGKFN